MSTSVQFRLKVGTRSTEGTPLATYRSQGDVMRTLVLCIGLLAAAQIRDSRERSPTKPDGIYVSVLPILGKAMIGDNLIDTALMVERTPMKQVPATSSGLRRRSTSMCSLSLFSLNPTEES